MLWAKTKLLIKQMFALKNTKENTFPKFAAYKEKLSM